MTIEQMKRTMDACYQAKRIREMLPPLPKGVTPSYIQFLDVIEKMEEKQMPVKVSDISEQLRIPRPGVTRTVKEMEEKGFLRKETSAEDGRIVYVSITEQGKQMSYEYNQKTFEKLVECMGEISEEEINCTIATIDKMYRIMSERRIDHA